MSGINILTLDQHNPHEGEISYIGYSGQDNNIITCGWDRVIKVHSDEKQEITVNSKGAVRAKPTKGRKDDKFNNLENLLRGRTEAHPKDLICGDYAPHLDLIATGGRDNKARIWDYERINCLEEIEGLDVEEGQGNDKLQNEISIVKFIAPFPLLLLSDTVGNILIFITAPHPKKGTCMLNWRNNYTLKSNSTITAIETFYDKDNFLLIIGDENGTVRVQDISAILKQPEPFVFEDMTKVANRRQRNPHRKMELKPMVHETQKQHESLQKKQQNDGRKQPIVPESDVLQVF